MNQVELLEKLADLIFEFKNDYEEKLHEQIAREIEKRNSLILKTSQSFLTPAEIVERCASIARGEK